MGALNEAFQLDALALNMLTMIGLALGVDYSLLIVSRFREELAAGRDVEERRRAGRDARRAGPSCSPAPRWRWACWERSSSRPGALLESATLGVVVACVLAVVTALFAIPAGLAALGTNVNRWQLWSSTGQNPWVRLSERVSRKPVAAVLLTTFPLLLLLGSRAGPRHRAAERREPAAGQRVAKELRGLPARPRRGMGDAVRGRLPDRGTDHDRGAAAAAEAVPERRRPASRNRGRAGPGIAARAHRRVAQADEADRVGRPPAGASRERPRAAAGGDGAPEQRPRAGRAGADELNAGLGQAADGSGQIARGHRVPRCPRPRQLADGVSRTGAGADRAQLAPRGGPARARASSTTRSTSWRG